MPYARAMRFVLSAILITASPIAPAESEVEAQPSLRIFDRLVGKCFTAAVGPGASDTHCFEAVYGGVHVRDRHVVIVDGKAAYRGETIYSRAGPDIVFTYYNVLGGVGHGNARPVAGGIAFTGSMRGSPTSKPQPMDSNWKWLSPAGYEASDGSGKPVLFKSVTRKAR